jgi:hypothetical protein
MLTLGRTGRDLDDGDVVVVHGDSFRWTGWRETARATLV